MKNSRASSEVWPKLNYADWKETCATLHMWTQIVGKIRLVKTPWTNHSWHVTLYLTARGLTTSPIPHGTDIFEIRFDFIDHQLRILKSDGAQNLIELKPRSVADFYKAVMAALEELKLPLKIDILPNEIPDPIPFDSGASSRGRTASSKIFVRGSAANAARSTFSGEVLIWRSHDFPGAPRLLIPAEFRTCRTRSRAKHTRRK